MSKLIKVKTTGHVTEVSDEYYKQYEKDGWFIEVPKPKPAVKKTAKKTEE